MIRDVAPDLQWAPERTRGAMRGRLLVTLASGEAPERVPHAADVASGRAQARLSLDGGPVDRTLHRYSPALRAMRVYAPAARIGGARAGRWDELEDTLGFSRTFRVDIDPESDLVALIEALGDLAVVDQISPVYLSVTPFLEPAGPLPEDLWYAHRMVGAASALEFEAGDSTLICAVVDSGVDLHHAELKQNLRPGVDTVDIAPEQVPRSMRLIGDHSGIDRVPMDVVGHGTACASIIGAHGERLPRGLGGAARLLPMRALAGAKLVGRRTLTALGSLVDIDLAVKLAVDLGARVLNLSFGTPETALRERDPRPHAAVIEYARRRGCVLVAASGNSGMAARYYPSCLDGVIAVGSVGPDRAPSSFTTRGDHVDVCAPGESIPSAGLGGYQRSTGTSFAAPFVAAACALLVSRAARYSQPIDGGAIRELVMRAAQPFPRGSDAAGCGAGILDVPAALHALDEELSRPADARGVDGRPIFAQPVRRTRPTARAP